MPLRHMVIAVFFRSRRHQATAASHILSGRNQSLMRLSRAVSHSCSDCSQSYLQRLAATSGKIQPICNEFISLKQCLIVNALLSLSSSLSLLSASSFRSLCSSSLSSFVIPFLPSLSLFLILLHFPYSPFCFLSLCFFSLNAAGESREPCKHKHSFPTDCEAILTNDNCFFRRNSVSLHVPRSWGTGFFHKGSGFIRNKHVRMRNNRANAHTSSRRSFIPQYDKRKAGYRKCWNKEVPTSSSVSEK